MTRLRVLVPALAACLVWAATASAQTAKPADKYDPAAEITIKGQIVAVISTQGADGVVGVHMDVKTDTGLVKVHVGPALFIGNNNFWFMCDEPIEITGAMVSHGGTAALWGRLVSKGDGKILKLRNEQGAPLWKVDGQIDPDGCGLAHAVIR